jgi:2,4-dienoyl-CoA reductase-like NADH-dependent reductase (Old Yellow Enzyme family)
MNRILFSNHMTGAYERYPHVFSPLSVNGARLKNRIVRTAHGTNYPAGYVNERLIAFHETRARGGVALTILEVASCTRPLRAASSPTTTAPWTATAN